MVLYHLNKNNNTYLSFCFNDIVTMASRNRWIHIMYCDQMSRESCNVFTTHVTFEPEIGIEAVINYWTSKIK